ncbi:MAG: hypothetical protein HY811_08700 [Planctomycetes bacterium]|nr:hypothetical protein [Planctomycetota bacterium]
MKFNVTRWIIFALVAIAIIIPVMIKERITLPESSSSVVKNIYDFIEKLPEKSPIIISVDFDPSSDEELRPMIKALLRHAFRKNLRVIGMTIWDAAAGGTLINIFNEMGKEAKKEDGVDYAIMPFKPGGSSIILLLSQNVYDAYPKDYKNNLNKDLPVFKGIKTLKDMKYAMCVSAGQAVDTWIIYGKEKGKMPLGAGCTAVMATDYYPFLQSKQLVGLMGGLSAAAQYESLIKHKDTATESMKPQTVVHALIIILIIIGNIMYFTGKRKKA